jgi:hypothetical protein
MNGGKFESGFLSSGLSQGVGQYMDATGIGYSQNPQGWDYASSAATAAVVGGTVSEITGGTFEQGALTAAMGRLMNDGAHAALEATRSRISALAWKYADENSHRFDVDTQNPPYDVGEYKCNLFVNDVIAQAGAGIPYMAGDRLYNQTGIGVPRYPATAGQWANPKFDIPGWQVVDHPQAGDVYSSGSHMGFIVERHDSFRVGVEQPYIGISANPRQGVRANVFGIQRDDGPKFTYRRYIGQ